MKFQVTIRFIGGNLEGLTHTSTYATRNPPAIGTRILKPVAGSPYEVIAYTPV